MAATQRQLERAEARERADRTECLVGLGLISASRGLNVHKVLAASELAGGVSPLDTSVQVRQLAADALTVMESQIYDACRKSAYQASSVPPGQLRKVEERDANGLKIVKFIGQRCFTDDFTIPGKKVRIRPFTDFRNSAAQ
jgi:hypothetical protein